jgi:DDE superfamily endonuclease
MPSIANDALPVLTLFAPAFTPATFARVQLLVVACILTTGRRTIANLLRIVPHRVQGSSSSYHRVLSQTQWSSLQLACALTHFVIRHLLPTGLITLVGDDTVDGHKGKKVYGKARHRDPVRSTKSYTAWRYGHKWVVLGVLVRFPFATRPWALPVLVALYRSEEQNRQRQRPHRTPAQLMCRLLRLMLLWFPDRQFLFVGDAGYGTHEVARFAHRHRARLTLVSKFHPDANLYGPPPAYKGKGRPRVKGRRRAKPKAAVARARRRQRLQVGWYGDGTRRVEAVTGTGHWYKAGRGLVPVRWVFVHDLDGTHRDEYFFTTDPTLQPKAVIGYYTARWNIETTFQELRAYLGLETTRGWCAPTVLRAAPCLFGLYTVVALLYEQLPAEAQGAGGVDWVGKEEVTFSDAITAVRRWLWANWVFAKGDHAPAFAKLPEPLREVLLYALAPAA